MEHNRKLINKEQTFDKGSLNTKWMKGHLPQYLLLGKLEE
jgi:hypothetical protein